MILDTSVLVELLRGSPDSDTVKRILSAIDDQPRSISMVQLAELEDCAIKYSLPSDDALEMVLRLATVVPLSPEIARVAARIKRERRLAGHRKFGLMDGIILATARAYGERLLSLDPDFSDLKDATVLN